MPASQTPLHEEHTERDRFVVADRPTADRPTADPDDGAPHAAPQQATEHTGAEQRDEHDEIPRNLTTPSTGKVILAAGAFVLLLAVLFLIGLFPHLHRSAQAQADANEMASSVPVVSVSFPAKSDSSRDLIFPADVHPNQTTAIFTRATGYLKHWYVDIQDKVKAGQLMAEIAAPDLDAELAQSQATVEQDKANVLKAQADLNLAKVTMQRYADAQKASPGSVTQEQVDQERDAYEDAGAALAQTKAAVVQAQANVRQLQVEVGFEKVVAPFDGVVTTRNYDNGAYLTPPTSMSGAKEMFDVAQTDLLRVYISVPQPDATAVQIGKKVYLVVRNYPARKFWGIVARTSQSLDETTRTLMVELDFPNPNGDLYAGMYGQAHLPVSDPTPTLLIPTSALLFNASGTTVALVDPNSKIHIQPVKVGRDFGTKLEVTQGLNPNDAVVTNPGERLVEGLAVSVAKTPNGQPASGRPKSQGGASASG